ncbi:proline--tRNA ligase, partial [Salmonella enterica subsp. enterica serovar Anatum]
LQAGEDIAAELDSAGLEVLFDDRPKMSPGVKFKDAELLGMPFIVILGRSFADGIVELRIRGGETLEVASADIVAKVRELVAAG